MSPLNPGSDAQDASTHDKYRNYDVHSEESNSPKPPRSGRPDPEKGYPDVHRKARHRGRRLRRESHQAFRAPLCPALRRGPEHWLLKYDEPQILSGK